MSLIESDNVLKLLNFIMENNHNLDEVTQRTPYYHMGATITDSILQAGLNYRNVVYPRVANLLTNFYEYKTTTDFIILFQTIPLGKLINWRNELKLNRIIQTSWLLYNDQVENEDQLSTWLNDNNINKLLEIKGIGPKTIDYLKMLSGQQAIAIDRHLFKFIELAGVIVRTYDEAHALYCNVAKKLNIPKYELDKKIWSYMAKA